jgi:hypothetical protein
MANEFVIKNGFLSQGDSQVTGSFVNILSPTNLQIQSNLSSSFGLGSTYIAGLGWTSLIISGSTTSFRTDGDRFKLNGITQGNLGIPAIGASLPLEANLQLFATGSDYVSIGTQFTDLSGIGGNSTLNSNQNGVFSGSYGNNSYTISINKTYGSNESSLNLQKVNNSGETIALNLNSGNDGFSIFSTLSQPTSSFLRLVSGSSNNLVDFRYDANYIQRNTIIGSTDLPQAKLHIKGNGITSATNALFVTNANGSENLFTIQDNGGITNGQLNNASGTGSRSFGFRNFVNGEYSHGEGYENQVNGIYAHAEGKFTSANGDFSHAEGLGFTEASLGLATTANGIASHAEGYTTTANGNYSHTEGSNTITNGEASHAEGYNTITVDSYQHAQGQFNLAVSGAGAFIVGNGIDNFNRSNLIFASGSSVQITGSLDVTEDVSLSTLTFTGSLTTGSNNLYFSPSYDVRNWYLTGKNFSVATQDATPIGLYFKDDGTRFYMAGTSNDRIYQYDVSTPWDVSTAIFNNVSASVATQDTSPTDLFISPDGAILFMIGDSDRVYRYNLTNPWDISAITFINSHSIVAEEANPNGLYFDPTGTKMYVVGTTGDDVNQYALGTPWDLTTVSFVQSSSVSPFETAPVAISFNEDGSRMYILGATGDDISEFRLTTPWDVSTSTFYTTGFTFPTEVSPGGLYFNQTEQVAYVLGTNLDTVIGLKTNPQVKYFGDSFVIDGQLFAQGRLETSGDMYSNGSLVAMGSITCVGSIFSSNSAFSTSTISLGTSTATSVTNIGGGTSTTINRFAYGAHISGSTKTVQIGTGGLTGSRTFLEIGTLNSSITSGRIGLSSNVFIAQNTNINGSLNINNNSSILEAAGSANGAIAVFDTFTEASDTLLSSHTPETGSGWSRVQISTFTTPTMTVFGATDTAGPTSTVSNQGVIYRQDTPLTFPDYEVSMSLVAQTSGDDYLWLFARYQNVNNWYGVRWSTTQANCALVKNVNGVFTILATSYVIPIATPTTLSIRVQDGIIAVLNGGNVVMSAYDASITSSGYAAVGGGNVGLNSTDDFSSVWKFDNFQVRYYHGAQTSTITGSLSISNILTLTPQDPLPSNTPTGSFAVSSSIPPKPYFWDGSTWNVLY